jgi:hypothetical protein
MLKRKAQRAQIPAGTNEESTRNRKHKKKEQGQRPHNGIIPLCLTCRRLGLTRTVNKCHVRNHKISAGVSQHRPKSAASGTRIGEASNPGPTEILKRKPDSSAEQKEKDKPVYALKKEKSVKTVCKECNIGILCSRRGHHHKVAPLTGFAKRDREKTENGAAKGANDSMKKPEKEEKEFIPRYRKCTHDFICQCGILEHGHYKSDKLDLKLYFEALALDALAAVTPLTPSPVIELTDPIPAPKEAKEKEDEFEHKHEVHNFLADLTTSTSDAAPVHTATPLETINTCPNVIDVPAVAEKELAPVSVVVEEEALPAKTYARRETEMVEGRFEAFGSLGFIGTIREGILNVFTHEEFKKKNTGVTNTDKITGQRPGRRFWNTRFTTRGGTIKPIDTLAGGFNHVIKYLIYPELRDDLMVATFKNNGTVNGKPSAALRATLRNYVNSHKDFKQFTLVNGHGPDGDITGYDVVENTILHYMQERQTRAVYDEKFVATSGVLINRKVGESSTTQST